MRLSLAATASGWLPSPKFVTKVQLRYLYLRNLDSAPFGGRLRVGALGVSVSLTRPRAR